MDIEINDVNNVRGMEKNTKLLNLTLMGLSGTLRLFIEMESFSTYSLIFSQYLPSDLQMYLNNFSTN